MAVTGGAFFNDLSNPDGSLALTNEVTSRHMSRVTLCNIASRVTCQGTSLDSCLGHSAPTSTGGGQYHYHGNINCTQAGAATGAADPDTCKLIGYYRDGVPVYGFCKDSNGG